MKTYIKPIAEIVLLSSCTELLDAPLQRWSVLDSDDKSTYSDQIRPGNPGDGAADWGGDAKGSSWSGWDDDED